MARIPRPKLGTSIASGSVGRQRINAPVEAFGGGEGLQAIGGAVSSLGQDVQQYAQRQRVENNNSDVSSYRAQSSAIWNEALIRAKRAQNKDEHDAIVDDANKRVEELAKASGRSGDAKAKILEMFNNEKLSRQNQFLITGLSVQDKETAAKNTGTRNTLTSSATDPISLAANKKELINSPHLYKGLTDEQRKEAVKSDLNAADKNFAGTLLNGAKVAMDAGADRKTISAAIEGFANFVEGSEHLTQKDKEASRLLVEKLVNDFEAIKEDRFVNEALAVWFPDGEESIDAIKSEEGQLEAKQDIALLVDRTTDLKDNEQRERVKGKLLSLMDQRFNLIDQERKADIEAQIADPDSNLEQLVQSPALSTKEKSLVQNVYKARQDAVRVREIYKQLPDMISNFNWDTASNQERIALYASIYSQPAAAQVVFKKMLDDKADASKRGTNYKDNFSQLSSLLKRRYQIDAAGLGEDADRVAEIDGVKMTPEQRIAKYANDMRYLRSLAEEHDDKTQVFDQEAEKYLRDTSQKTTKQIMFEKMKEFK